MQPPRTSSKLGPGTSSAASSPAEPTPGPGPTPSPTAGPTKRAGAPGLYGTVAFEQAGVPDASPRAVVRPASASGGRKPQRFATVAYDQGAFQEANGRQTLAYEGNAFEEPEPPKTIGYGPKLPPGPGLPPAPVAAGAPAMPVPAGGPAAPSPVPHARPELAVADTVGVASAAYASLSASGPATDPRAALAGTLPAPMGSAEGIQAGTNWMAAGAAAPAPAPAERLATAGGADARSTVLPHVEVVGQDLQLRREPRPRYEPVGPLGEGGVGVVVKANDNDIGRAVALKKLRPEHQGPSVLLRFVDEIRTVGQLEHPNIVPIHDVGIDSQGEYYFVMKYVDGETIETIIDRLASGDREAHRQYPFERRVDIFRAVLEAIRFAHQAGIIHRDIKPANVMVGRYGEVVVMDWGLAKRVAEPSGSALDAARAAAIGQGGVGVEPPGSPPGAPPPLKPRGLSRPAVGTGGAMALQTQLGAVLGTPAYMSPEQARGEVLDVRSDVYSLCLMLHEFLSLRHPLADKQSLDEVLRAVVAEPVPLAGFVRSPHQPVVPMDLNWFVRKGLHKDPAKRYQSVDEMIERLRLRSQGIVPIECHLTFVKRVTGFWIRLSERFPMSFTAAMLLLVAAVIASVVRLVL